MSIASLVNDFAARVAQEFNAVRSEIPSGSGGSYTFAQVRNSDTTHNINQSASYVTCPINGVSDYVDADFSISGDGIAVSFDGWIKASWHIAYTVSGSRVNVVARVARDRSTVITGYQIEAKSGYVRNTSGHNESSPNGSQMIEVLNGDIILVQTRRESSATTNTVMDDGGCLLLLERFS